MCLQKPFGFTTEPYELGSDVSHACAEFCDINRAWWHACEDELGEESVDIFAGFEAL